jgi:hypothetical protein
MGATEDIISPYGSSTRIPIIAGTDIPAVEGLRGQGDEPAFGRTRNASGDREINASSNRDLMRQISAMIGNARSDQPMKMRETDPNKVKARHAEFKAAYGSPSPGNFQVIGEVMSDEIWETLGREGFTNKLLALQNITKGDTGRVKVRKKDVTAWQVTTDVKVQENRIRQDWVYPPEYYILCFILIEDKEVEQSSADILDEKFQDGLEAILVKDDNITRSLLNRSITSFNDVVYYTNFNPTVFTTTRTQVNRWGTPAQTMVLAFDVWDDIIADPDFVAWFDPVTKHELVLEGHLGRILGVELITDALRYPTLQVLQPGEVYILGSPITVGTKVIRKELESRAIDQYNIGRPARGWFMHMIQGTIIVSGRSTAGCKRI